MAHDFEQFPELTNQQMHLYYFESPHKQITEDFNARVVEVTDGDTVKVKTNFRDFDFKVRLAEIAAPELKEGGERSRDELKKLIEGAEIEVLIDYRNRVGKWGRLIGTIFKDGININEHMVRIGAAVPFDQRANDWNLNLDRELKIPESEW